MTETPDNDNTDNIITENTEAPAVTVTPSEDKDTPEAVETPGPADIAEVTETPSVTDTPEPTVTPEADKDNIFDGTEKDITRSHFQTSEILQISGRSAGGWRRENFIQ